MAEPVVHLATAGPARRLLARRGLSLPDLRAPGLRHVVVPGGWLPGVPRGALRWERLLRDQSEAPAPAPRDPDATALVVFTSGTTTAPRAVTHTRSTLSAGLHALLGRLGLRTDDVVHTDQMMLGLPVLVAGATWSFAPLGADGATFARTAARRAASVGYAVPATLAAAAATGALPATLRLLALGGAPVTPAVVRRLQVALPGARVLAVYGLTEALPVATVDGAELLDHATRPGAGLLLGHPVPGTGVEVDDTGQLHVAGPQVSPGYLGQPPSAPSGRVATGDLVELLPDGRLELRGRVKDMLLRGVTNIYPALVEPLLETLPGVAAAAMVGLPDPITADEVVVLVVVPAAGATAGARRRRPPGACPPCSTPPGCPTTCWPWTGCPPPGGRARWTRTHCARRSGPRWRVLGEGGRHRGERLRRGRRRRGTGAGRARRDRLRATPPSGPPAPRRRLPHLGPGRRTTRRSPAGMGEVCVVLHCAAAVDDWLPVQRQRPVTVGGTRAALSTWPGARFVHVSSASVYPPWRRGGHRARRPGADACRSVRPGEGRGRAGRGGGGPGRPGHARAAPARRLRAR